MFRISKGTKIDLKNRVKSVKILQWPTLHACFVHNNRLIRDLSANSSRLKIGQFKKLGLKFLFCLSYLEVPKIEFEKLGFHCIIMKPKRARNVLRWKIEIENPMRFL